jgi:hypothetical protein
MKNIHKEDNNLKEEINTKRKKPRNMLGKKTKKYMHDRETKNSKKSINMCF